MLYNKLSFANAEKVRNNIIEKQKLEIANLYKEWAKDLDRKAQIYKLKTTSSSWVVENNAKQLKKQLEEQSKAITEEVMLSLNNNLHIISDAVVKDAVEWAKQFGFDEAAISKAYSSVPDYAIRNLVTGNVYDSGWSLSKRIWSSNEQNMKQAYEIVAGGLAQNKSVYEICKDLSKYVEPGARKPWNLIAPDGKKIYPKQVDYNAQRLARTLAQHTYQQTFVAVTQNNPFILKYRWIANGSRVCEICADRDGKEFDKFELPLDHPNGMCTMEPVEDSNTVDKLADWINNEDGVYPEIDKFAKEFGYNAKKPTENTINTRMTQLIGKYGSSSAKTHTAWLNKLNNNEKIAVKEFKNSLGMKWPEFYNKYVYKTKEGKETLEAFMQGLINKYGQNSSQFGFAWKKQLTEVEQGLLKQWAEKQGTNSQGLYKQFIYNPMVKKQTVVDTVSSKATGIKESVTKVFSDTKDKINSMLQSVKQNPYEIMEKLDKTHLLKKPDKDAIKSYSSDSYRRYNPYLRAKVNNDTELMQRYYNNMSSAEQKHIKRLESLFEGKEQRLSEDVVVRRGSSIGDFTGLFTNMEYKEGKEKFYEEYNKAPDKEKFLEQLNKDFAGKIGTYAAPTSTSSVYDRGFSGELEVIMNVKEGTRGMSIVNISRYGKGEGEFLLAPGTKAKFVGLEQSDGHSGSKFRLFVDVSN